jgi:predicted phosphohydrolase
MSRSLKWRFGEGNGRNRENAQNLPYNKGMNPSSLSLAITADLHYGTRHQSGNQATLQLAAHLAENPPDILLLGGDIGAGDDFERCLALFDGLECQKGLVPGNHDIWVRSDDVRGDSLMVYESHLPRLCREHGFVYLDQESLLLPDHDLAIVGTMNWYDYSWAIDLLKAEIPDWEERIARKRFTRGVHNDLHFVRWPYTDGTFTDRIVADLTQKLEQAMSLVSQAIVVAHHPPLQGLLYPASNPLPLDALLWRAFSGNRRVEELLHQWGERIPLVFCGHTHAARDCQTHGIQGINIGGDYHFKRLLRFNWPLHEVEALEFHGN